MAGNYGGMQGGGGSGSGGGAGKGAGRTGAGAGRGRMSGRGFGPEGECLCPQCGARTPHQRGTPCFEQKCPNCGAAMVRA